MAFYQYMTSWFVSQTKLPESVSLSDLSANKCLSPDASASLLTERTAPGSFHQFSRLPMELQLQIWKAAARQEPDGGPRIFATTPSIHHFAIIVEDLKMLYSVVSYPRSHPTVFQICRESRKAAEKEYVLWKAGPATRRRMVYVHRLHDTLYFPQSMTQTVCLQNVFGKESMFLIGKRWTKSEPILLFFEQLQSFRHVAVDWNVWWSLQGSDALPLLWTQSLPSLTEILLILLAPSTTNVPADFQVVTPGTVRARTAKIVSSNLRNNLDLFRLQFPDKQPPKVKILTTDSKESSSGDEQLLTIMENRMLDLPHYFSP